MNRLYELKQLKTVYGFARLRPDSTAQGMGGRNAWYLSYIWVSPRKRGRHYGHIILARVCRAADQEHAELILGVDPSPDSPMRAAALRSFYRRFGFVSRRTNINLMRRKPVVIDDNRRRTGSTTTAHHQGATR